MDCKYVVSSLKCQCIPYGATCWVALNLRRSGVYCVNVCVFGKMIYPKKHTVKSLIYVAP